MDFFKYHNDDDLGFGEEESKNEVWLDVRTHDNDSNPAILSEEEVTNLSTFIINYDVDPSLVAKHFTSISHFNSVVNVLERLELVIGIKLDLIKFEVMKLLPVLVLMDIGGSVLYRCSSSLEIERKHDF